MKSRHGMRRFAAAVILSFLASALSGQLSAEPNKLQYELQERCGKAAAAKFASDHPEGPEIRTKDDFTVYKYENHYNATLNKCFLKYTMRIVKYKSSSDPGYTTTDMALFDVNENKQYGYFLRFSFQQFPDYCIMRDKTCTSEEEWQDFVKPFMED